MHAMAIAQENYIIHTLRQHPPFNTLPDHARLQLARDARLKHTSRSELVVPRGTHADGVLLVLDGELKQSLLAGNGNERIVRLVHAGACLYEDAVFANQPQMLATQAVRESLLLFLPCTVLHDVMHATPSLGDALAALMAGHMRELLAAMELCEQRTSQQRVAHYLIAHARDGTEGHEVQLESSKQAIASQLNMTPESFSRVLNRFTREGYIHARSHRAIRLTDLKGLRSLVS
jgi:CRP-like cAMP-binding protein